MDKSHELSETLLDTLGVTIRNAVKKSIEEARDGRTNRGLRLSAIGKPDRQLWYDNNPEGTPVPTSTEDKRSSSGALLPGDDQGSGGPGNIRSVQQSLPEPTFVSGPDNLKFLFGHILEALLVYLIAESGHTLTHAQEDLELCGVPGHPDGILDRHPTDIKSCSGYAYKNKFLNRGLLKPGAENDSFGYIDQLKAYREALIAKYPHEDIDVENVAWIAFNKESGEICTLKADVLELPRGSASDRIKHLQKMVVLPKPPEEKCYPDIPDGKSGNRVLNKLCTWCHHKDRCWKDANGGTGLRTFEYSTGPKWFTNVAKQPRVTENRDYEFVVES